MRRAGVLVAFFSVLISACSNHKVTSTAVERYPIDGEIVHLSEGEQTATIRHKAIPAWHNMGAMTMNYSIPSKTDFGKLHEGDHITGTVFVQGDEFWVGDITDDTKQP